MEVPAASNNHHVLNRLAEQNNQDNDAHTGDEGIENVAQEDDSGIMRSNRRDEDEEVENVDDDCSIDDDEEDNDSLSSLTGTASTTDSSDDEDAEPDQNRGSRTLPSILDKIDPHNSTFQDGLLVKIKNTVPEDYQPKLNKILVYLLENDVRGLRRCALDQGGLLSDHLRRLIWPKLLRQDVIETIPHPEEQIIQSHPFYQQVILDVNRSLKRFPPSIRETQRLAMQDHLVKLIMRILVKNPELHYYQGYHDICVTFLLILGQEMSFHLVNKLSTTHLSMFMGKTMEQTSAALELIPMIVERESPELGRFLEKSSVGTIFALSWVITWFSHVIQSYDTVGRLFDLFIASSEWMPFYLTAAIVLHERRQILELDCDMASVHHYLSRIVDHEERLPFESLISQARYLSKLYPESELSKERTKRYEKQKARNVRPVSVTTFVKRNVKVIVKTGFFTLTVFVVVVAALYQYLWPNN